MSFRLQLPIARQRSSFALRRRAVWRGGQMYREWKISGDTEWLKRHWPAIKSNISFAWSAANVDKWDADKDGVLEGRQHHTLDMELFGPELLAHRVLSGGSQGCCGDGAAPGGHTGGMGV